MKRIRIFLICLLFAGVACDARQSPPQNCEPTPHDEIGPFYRTGAPVRSRVGTGYLLKGRVLSVKGCEPLGGSRLEFWLVNPRGQYDDDHRATVYADRQGFYRFESHRPPGYLGRPPHIHIMVTTAGHEPLITQHYPHPDQGKAELNLVLEPRR